MVFDSIKRAFGSEEELEYIEIDLGREVKKSKVVVRPFIRKSYKDGNYKLNSLKRRNLDI